VESGIVGERRLPFDDDRAAFSDAFILVFLLFRIFYSLTPGARMARPH
jgi:hypothetical protein